jgi:pSer/pThr/pTyr-binding forkhead associated (FHA) protein
MTVATARLEVVSGRAIGMSILFDDELLIGRHAEGAGRLADDEEISRSHARISLDRSGFCAIEDLGSTNGTFVNGLRVSGPLTLSVGDTIELGATTLVVRELPIAATERSLQAVPPRTTMTRVATPAAPTNQVTPLSGSPEGRGLGGDPPQAIAGETADPAGGTRVSLRVQINFAARRATIALEDGTPPLRLVFDGDAWRPAPSSRPTPS